MIKMKGLSFSYAKSNKLFPSLDLELPDGSIYGLLGKNGAGKTTLLKLITGLLFPQGGECEVMGCQPSKRWPRFLEEIYLIPEEFFVPSVTAKEYERLYAPFYPRFDQEYFRKYLDEFSLNLKQKLSALSYGQKKKFLLAFGLATNCRLFILDEPTNGLDIPAKSQFRKLLATALTEDRSFIISTHQVRDMEQLIDPVLILDEGEIIFFQSMQEVSNYLFCHIQPDIPAGVEVIHFEKVLGGYAVLAENRNKEESKIDLELLFNAVVSNKDRIKQIFIGGGSYED